MEKTLALLNLLERLLGKGERKTKGNYAFICPFHTSDPPGKKKLEINLELELWECWTCGKINGAKGRRIRTLLSKMKAPQEYFDELKLIIPPKPNETKKEYDNKTAELPKEFISLHQYQPKSSLEKIKLRQAWAFLKKRNLTSDDVLKYNIGICFEGDWADRIIVPSYDENGQLNFFNGRDFTDTLFNKYKNPEGVSAKYIIGLELFINWDAPIILVEGIYDALTIKRNVIPLYGKVIHDKLMKKLVESSVDRIYVALDKDASKEALKYCEQLMTMGKKTYYVELPGKDPNELGFEKMLEILENTSQINFQTLMYKKLEKI